MIGQPAPPWQIAQPLNGTNPGLPGQAAFAALFQRRLRGLHPGRALPFTLELAERYPDLQIVAIHSSFEAGSEHPPSRATSRWAFWTAYAKERL